MRILQVACLLLILPFVVGCNDPQAETAVDDTVASESVAAEPVTTTEAEVADTGFDAGFDGETETVVPVRSPEQAELAAREPDVIYVPTPQPVVDAMLKMANVRTGDVLYDLGSGDGRIPITAAREYGVRGIGIDINPVRIAEANANAKQAGVTGLVTFKQQDLFESDFSDASVVTLYLLDSLNEKLRPKLLRELKPGTRIVSHAFRMGDWEPERSQVVDGSSIFLWTVPVRDGRQGAAAAGN